LSLFIVGSEATAQDTAKVKITIKVSDKTPSFTNRRLVVMLYHNHPLQEDRGPTAVDRYIDVHFSHEKGTETVIKLILGENAKLKSDVQYTVTANLFQGLSTITHVSECEHENGPFRVLTYGHPRKITLELRPAPQSLGLALP
jgi:hypothetical protein